MEDVVCPSHGRRPNSSQRTKNRRVLEKQVGLQHSKPKLAGTTQEHLQGQCSDPFSLVLVLDDECQGTRPRPYQMQFGQTDRLAVLFYDKGMMYLLIR
jgi:hypothetical protein